MERMEKALRLSAHCIKFQIRLHWEFLKNRQLKICGKSFYRLWKKKKTARAALTSSEKFVDQIYRCYGMLKYARMISTEEFYEFISYLRIGISQGIYPEEKLKAEKPGIVECADVSNRKCNLMRKRPNRS